MSNTGNTDEKNKTTVVVTGGAGFVGSHLCERLLKDGYNVISLDNYFTGTKENHVRGVEYREGHTKDIEKHVPETPDIIYHLGEYARVEQSVLEPTVVHNLNTLGTQGVIDFWRAKNVSGQECKLVYAGSSTKFGDSGENRNASPYAKTKAENSERVREVGEQENLPYAVTYFYNVYGPNERSGVYGTVIEHFKRMYLSGAPCAVVSPGTQTRNFTHVADIVDALVLIGERGHGDEYGLGHKEVYTILDVAHMFGFGEEEIVMFPERRGNRMHSALDTNKAAALGWNASRTLSEYIRSFVSSRPRGAARGKRVLVFSTTMHPVAGRAEDSFVDLARELPDVHFDVVTTRFIRTPEANTNTSLPRNITLHRVGVGRRVDKFLLPLFGFWKGVILAHRHTYLFAWAIMASYAASAGIMLRRVQSVPLLVTLADQNIDDLSPFRRFLLGLLISKSDQVYGTHQKQEASAVEMGKATLPRHSLGEGDAFANALRFAYAEKFRGSSIK